MPRVDRLTRCSKHVDVVTLGILARPFHSRRAKRHSTDGETGRAPGLCGQKSLHIGNRHMALEYHPVYDGGMARLVAGRGVDTSAKARTIFLIIHSFQQKSAERPYQPSAPVAHLRSIPPTSWPSWASALSALSLQQVIFPCSSFLQQQHSFVGAGAASAANAAEDMVSASAPKRYLFVMILLRSIVENCSAMPRAAGALEEQ